MCGLLQDEPGTVSLLERVAPSWRPCERPAGAERGRDIFQCRQRVPRHQHIDRREGGPHTSGERPVPVVPSLRVHPDDLAAGSAQQPNLPTQVGGITLFEPIGEDDDGGA